MASTPLLPDLDREDPDPDADTTAVPLPDFLPIGGAPPDGSALALLRSTPTALKMPLAEIAQAISAMPMPPAMILAMLAPNAPPELADALTAMVAHVRRGSVVKLVIDETPMFVVEIT